MVEQSASVAAAEASRGRARLEQIRTPTLIIGGERDVSDIHSIVDKLAREIPGAEKRMISGAGHIVPMEKPEKFNALALKFLRSST